MRIGFGCDLHILEKGRKLVLGGVEVASDFGPISHSDGDVLIHAIIDALLGAVAGGDIGTHFPDSDPKYKDVSSLKLLNETVTIVKDKKYKILNIDTTVVIDKPRLNKFNKKIAKNVSRALGIDEDCFGLKAKTSEGTRKNIIEAYAVCLLEQKR